ncbi:MAG: gamma carbonic anhydrase family protein [Bdellovibrionota bacterium]
MPQANIIKYKNKEPILSKNVFVAGGVYLIGNVDIGEDSSIWFNSVLRGDVNFIKIGKRTNIQDNSVVHVTDGGNPTIIGDDVTIGHSATIHACIIEDLCLIGMGATILDGAVIQKESLVGAGSVVPPGKTYPPGSLIVGSPAKVKRQLNEKERASLLESAIHYQEIVKSYLY